MISIHGFETDWAQTFRSDLENFMKKFIAFALVVAAVLAASTLNVKVEIRTNSAYACNTSDC